MDPDPDPYPRVRMLGNLTFFKTIFKKLYFLHLHGYVQELMKCFKGKSDKKNKFLTFISCVIAKGGPGAVLRRTAGSGLRIRTASLRPWRGFETLDFFKFIYNEKFNWKALTERKVPFVIEVLGRYAFTSPVAGGAGVRFPDTHRHGSWCHICRSAVWDFASRTKCYQLYSHPQPSGIVAFFWKSLHSI